MKRGNVRLSTRVIEGRLPAPVSVAAIARCLKRSGHCDEQFLLESAGGPKADTKQSFLGIGVLLRVEVKNGLVSLGGNVELVDVVKNHLLKSGSTTLDSAASMALIRVVEDTVDVVWTDHSVTKPPLLTILGYDAVASKIIGGVASSTPDLIVVLPVTTLTIDHQTNTYSIATLSESGVKTENDLEAIRIALLSKEVDLHIAAVAAGAAPLSLTVSASEYMRGVERCLEHIINGDIYQIQLGHEVLVQSANDPIQLYERLRKLNPSPYMFLISTPSVSLVGASPELFVRIEDRLIQMRPLAGTLPKAGNHMGPDSLDGNVKERAEHIMLVDLCRNDIGRVADFGSVQVSQLMAVAEYPFVFHLVSTITGRLRNNLDVWDAIEACSPAGTLTGCPKIRATQIIADQEWTRRGLYAGSVIFTNGRGSLVSALIIRSLVIQDGTVSVRASAGIVADSDVEREWHETLAKIRSSLAAVTSTQL